MYVHTGSERDESQSSARTPGDEQLDESLPTGAVEWATAAKLLLAAPELFDAALKAKSQVSSWFSKVDPVFVSILNAFASGETYNLTLAIENKSVHGVYLENVLIDGLAKGHEVLSNPKSGEIGFSGGSDDPKLRPHEFPALLAPKSELRIVVKFPYLFQHRNERKYGTLLLFLSYLDRSDKEEPRKVTFMIRDPAT